MQFSSVPCHIVPLRSKYSPQTPILQHLQCTFHPQCERPSFTPIQNNRQNDSSEILISKFLDSTLEDERFCTEWYQTFPDFNLLLLSSWLQFWFVKFVLKYLNCSALSKEQLSTVILWIAPAFWSAEINMYCVLSTLTSSLIFWLATTKDYTLFSTVSTPVEVDGQRHAKPALTPGKTRRPLYRKLGAPQDRSGQVRKIFP